MAILEDYPKATGAPGIPPRWTRSAKDIVGTAYATSSRVWYTLSSGVLNEIYFPTIDMPQVRDMQFLVTDGESFFDEERRDMVSETEYLGEHGLGVHITSGDRQNRYWIFKEIIADPHQPCLLIDTRFECIDPALAGKLHLYVLLAPHLAVGGWGNNGNARADRRSRISDREQKWHLARDQRQRSVRRAFMRLCRHHRRMAGPQQQLQTRSSLRRRTRTATSR